ncbi:flagellar filament capping protein FliD [Lacrimispora amygdalina]|uniref:flagellar filament capping protein FliD n=1 Tax=Lacrimispora amygdalina TaxID=253257 RepID=UPI000BE2EFED|nr:flagellar filament capping protein FliD [Lacrimispora amygdalina]
MASALNSIKNGSASTIRGYGGLASGLDRDTLIEGMTASTRAKIAKQQKKKQTYAWQQEAYRSISSKLVEFSKKYTSYTNPSTNLSSPSFWARSSITPVGANSKYVSVSGSSSGSDNISIVGVKQLASKASIMSNDKVSDGKLTTGEINFTTPEPVSTLEGQALYFKYGSKTYAVSLSSGTASDGFTYDYSTAESAQKSITRALKNVSIGDGKTLADVLEAKTTPKDAGDPQLAKLDFISHDTAGNTLQIVGGSKGALSALGISDIDSISDANKTINGAGFSSELKNREQKFYEDKTFLQRVAGKSISFTYNGTTKSITFDEAETGQYNNITDLAQYMQKQLDKQFGNGRIAVSGDSGKLEFKTMIPNTTSVDDSSVLAISSADMGVIGKNGALKVETGESNRLNLTSSLINSGLTGLTTQTADTELKLKINNVSITGLTYGSSMNEIINKINASDAGVTVSYLKNADKFSIVSKVDGSAGKIEFDTSDPLDASSVLFQDYTTTVGQDAIVKVKYGESADPIELIRGNNSFDLDGMNITVNGTFGYEFTSDTSGNYVKTSDNEYKQISNPGTRYKYVDGTGYIEDSSGTFVQTTDNNYVSTSGGLYKSIPTEPITFNAKTDSESIVKAVTDMVKDYNEMLEMVNKEVSTKPDRKYEPLTDEQKADMTEDQIKKWEEKAKAGMLFNDSDLRALSDSMRFIFDSGSADKASLASFGITTSSNYGDAGKLVFDETKFKAALETKAADVQKLFTKKEDTLTGDKGGVMARLTAITDKYASTTGATKGILIERAGSVYAPTSILQNSLQKSMDSIDTIIEGLNRQLKSETDRYIKQFTNLETMISQMNSQSSWLSSAFNS